MTAVHEGQATDDLPGELIDPEGFDEAWADAQVADFNEREARLNNPDSDPDDRFPRIDWAEAFSEDFTQVDWLLGRFTEVGQQISITGAGKAGKSLFVQEWVWRAITGRPFLGDGRRDPISVLYFDRENNRRDIVTRLKAFGANHEELDRLDYRLFPRFSGPLDAPPAAAELLGIVEKTSPHLVILDTVSRFIAGKENDADTWLAFYRLVHAPLKARRVAAARLDHFGKDEERGARGSSAKNQDVDHAWELTIRDEKTTTDPDSGVTTVVTNLKLARTYTRTGLGSDALYVTRRGMKNELWLPGGTRHELTDGNTVRQHEQLIDSYVDQLLMAGAPDLGRDRLRSWAVQKGILLPGKASELAEVARRYKAELKNRGA